MGVRNIAHNNIDLEDTNYDKNDPDTTVQVRFLAWHIKFKKLKELKKALSEKLMPLVWRPNKWWDWCMSEDEKKEIDPMFIEDL